MRLRLKMWLESGEKKPVMGDGLLRLLQAVEAHGSISKAAQDLSISYKQAWSRIKRAERNLGLELVTTHSGGIDGGGAHLTPRGRDFVTHYSMFRETADRMLQDLYLQHFPGN
ncbi:MAG: LysR family transcriptional regulator [Bacillota bacterium]